MDDLDSDRGQSPEEADIEEIRETVTLAIRAMRNYIKDTTLEASKMKAAVSDLLKLLQLRKELEGGRPRHISVRWINEWKTSND